MMDKKIQDKFYYMCFLSALGLLIKSNKRKIRTLIIMMVKIKNDF